MYWDLEFVEWRKKLSWDAQRGICFVCVRPKCQSTSCDQLGAGWRFRKQEWWRKSTVRRLLAGQLGAAWQQHWRHRPLAWRLKSGPASSKQPLAIRKQAAQNSPLLDQKQTIDWLCLVYHGIANSTPMSHPIMSSVAISDTQKDLTWGLNCHNQPRPTTMSHAFLLVKCYLVSLQLWRHKVYFRHKINRLPKKSKIAQIVSFSHFRKHLYLLCCFLKKTFQRYV